MLKTKKTFNSMLLCIAAAVLLLQINVLADDTSSVAPESAAASSTASQSSDNTESSEAINDVMDISNITSDNIHSMTKGDFIKTSAGGACTVVSLKSKDLTFDTDEAEFAEFNVKKGDTVTKGQVIATFTIPTSDAELTKRQLALSEEQTQYQTNLDSFDERISTAQTTYDNTTDETDKETANLQLQQLNLQKKQYQHQEQYKISGLQKSLSDLQDQYSKTTVTSPFDGVVDSLGKLSAGDTVKGVVIATITDPKSRLLYAENSGGLLDYNQVANVSFGKGSSKTDITGKIISTNTLFCDISGFTLNPLLKLTPTTNAILIKLDDQSAIDTVKSSYTINFTCTYVDIKDVWLIDQDLVVEDKTLSYVDTYDNGNYRKSYFYPGGKNGQYVWMLKGLDDDTKIIEK